MTSNSRKDLRRDYRGMVTVAWDTAAGPHYATARCVDISEHGLALNMHHSIPARSFVTFRIDILNLSGRAVVRHCSKRGAYFRIGLEFGVGVSFQVESEMISVD